MKSNFHLARIRGNSFTKFLQLQTVIFDFNLETKISPVQPPKRDVAAPHHPNRKSWLILCFFSKFSEIFLKPFAPSYAKQLS
jgi:hypothetical protein